MCNSHLRVVREGNRGTGGDPGQPGLVNLADGSSVFIPGVGLPALHRVSYAGTSINTAYAGGSQQVAPGEESPVGAEIPATVVVANPVDPGLCVACGRSFKGARGLGQHVKKAHPELSNEDIDIERKKLRWVPEESRRMAKREADLVRAGVRFINKELVGFVPGRSLEAIKSHRKSNEYRELVRHFQEQDQLEELGAEVDESEDIEVGASAYPAGQDALGGLRAALERLVAEPTDATAFAEGELTEIVSLSLKGLNVAKHLDDYLRMVFTKPRSKHFTKNMSEEEEAKKPPRLRKDQSARQARKTEYARVQHLYRKSRKRCARVVLGDEELDPPDTRNAREFNEYWGSVFNGPTPVDVGDGTERPAEELDCLLYEVTLDEIRACMPKPGSASGPDGFSVRLLRSVPLRVLGKLYNLILFMGTPPQRLCQSYTTFIPKVSNPSAPGEFRPITVGSVILRHLNKIMAKRLLDVSPFDDRQRAFQPSDGCQENIALFQAIVAESKRLLRPVHLAVMDLTKAFDTVAHGAVVRAAARRGVPLHFLHYVEDLYRESVVTYTVGGRETRCRSNRGVRQGDPLSPWLFNSVLDILLGRLPDHIGFALDGKNVNALAYADDLILIASTAVGLQELLDLATEVLGPMGLKFNVAKSRSLSLVPSGRDKKLKVVSDLTFCVEGCGIPTTHITDSWRYLGVDMSPFGRKSVTTDLTELLLKVSKAPLKPQQRMVILRTFLVPRYYHKLVLGRVNSEFLKRLDIQIRGRAREWLRLPNDTPIGYFHAKISDGGLGVPSLRTLVPRLKVARIERLLESTSPILVTAALTPGFRAELRRYHSMCTFEGVQILDAPGACRFWATRLHSSWDGMALRESSQVRHVHTWVADGSFLPGWEFIDLVKARVNALPTRARMARQTGGDRNCRAGCEAVESLAHVAQCCFRTHGQRVKRHNAICKSLADRLTKKGWRVSEEPRFATSEGIRKPDLVVEGRGQTHVLDVQVVGTGESLEVCSERKLAYYANNADLSSQLAVRGGGIQPAFQAITLSFRGLMARSTWKCLKRLGVSKRDAQMFCLRALQGTVVSWRRHGTMTSRNIRAGSDEHRSWGLRPYHHHRLRLS